MNSRSLQQISFRKPSKRYYRISNSSAYHNYLYRSREKFLNSGNNSELIIPEENEDSSANL